MVPNSTNLNAGLQAAERRSYCDQCLQDTPNGCCLCDLCPACCKAQCEEQGHVPFAADGEHGNCHLPDTDEAHWDWRRAGPTRAKAFNNGVGGAPDAR